MVVTHLKEKALKKRICRNCIHWKASCYKCKKRGIRTGPGYGGSCKDFVGKYKT